MTGGAGQPPLGRPAWGLCHLVPTFSGWLGLFPGVGGKLPRHFPHASYAGQPHLGRSAWLWHISALRCRVTLIQGLVLLLKSDWVLVK